MTKVNDRQVVVRLPSAMYRALEVDAEQAGRTVAQTVRFAVRRHLGEDTGMRDPSPDQ